MPRTAGSTRPARIRDVAAQAGVSTATVSRVLTGNTPVAAAKRDRVLAAVEALGYRPSAVARSLSLGTTGVIGVVVPFFTHGATSARLRGVMERAAPEGYDVMVFNVESARERADAFAKFARRDRLDGLIVVALPVEDEQVRAVRREGLPTVLVDVEHEGLSSVAVDNVAGGELATRHLLERGHTRIAYVGDGPVSPLGFTSSEPRVRGYRRALEAAGLEVDERLVWRAPIDPDRPWRGPHNRVDARAGVAGLLRGPAPPTAVFAASDLQAVGALEAAREAGARVPEDLAVIGFDDTELADIVGLTTVRQSLERSGAEGTGLLLAALAGDLDALEGRVALGLPLEVVERRTSRGAAGPTPAARDLRVRRSWRCPTGSARWTRPGPWRRRGRSRSGRSCRWAACRRAAGRPAGRR